MSGLKEIRLSNASQSSPLPLCAFIRSDIRTPTPLPLLFDQLPVGTPSISTISSGPYAGPGRGPPPTPRLLRQLPTPTSTPPTTGAPTMTLTTTSNTQVGALVQVSKSF